eukprot:11674532-Ditylum_brightwellii.AAC.1
MYSLSPGGRGVYKKKSLMSRLKNCAPSSSSEMMLLIRSFVSRSDAAGDAVFLVYLSQSSPM